MRNEVHLIYSTDSNYLLPTLVSASSAIAHATGKVVIHVITDKVSDSDYDAFQKRLQCVKGVVSVQRHVWKDEKFSGFPRWHNSTLVYARMVADELLPDVDWAISVDGDTLWLGDPFAMLQLRKPELLFQASIDPPPPVSGFKDVQAEWFEAHKLIMPSKDRLCCGLMMLNLKKMRSVKFSSQCMAFLRNYPDPPYCEQMVMCYLGQGDIAALPKEWGVFSVHHTQINIMTPCLVHYVQDLPWKRVKAVHLISDIVLVWHDFAHTVLGLNLLDNIPISQRLWKRCVFLLFKELPFLKKIHPMLAGFFENTRGIPREAMAALHSRFARMVK